MAYQPKVICFACKFSWGFAVASAKLNKQNGSAIPLICSGKIDASHLTQAFNQGADGVLVLGCNEGDCHFMDGNLEFKKRTMLFREVLKAYGIEGSRIRYFFGLDADGSSIDQIIEDFTTDLKTMGPSIILKPQEAAKAWNI
ncbi:MAG: hydrogenase iron-sulfur subunit [Chloroflexi bacterium]|nr:hydrogenase iron-sulfur subunit [Chloroflexota bacterium]